MSNQRLQQGLRVTLAGLAVNALLAAGKLAAGIAGHSQALIADAMESFADIFSSLIVWRGLVVAAAPPDADHPYGHGKAEPIAAAMVAGMLLVAAGGIIFQSTQNLFVPRSPPAAFTLVVLVVVVLVKELLYRRVAREGLSLESSAVLSDAWHHRSDAITSLGAAIGISVAIVGGPEYTAADSIAAIASACIIGVNGLRMMRPALAELMDTAPGPGFTAEIQKSAREVSGVEGVEKCFVRKMGYQYFVDLHVEVDPDMPVKKAHEIAHQVKDKIRERMPSVRDVLVHIEPRR